MRKNHLKSLFILIIAFLLMLGTFPSARADDPTPPPLPRPPIQVANVVLLGDSYSAGNGAGEYDTAAPGHYRSRNNWASHYVNWLNSKKQVYTRYTNLAKSGSTTKEVVKEQVTSMPTDADLVMFSAGGNDGDFGKVVETCFALFYRSPNACQLSLKHFQNFVNDRGENGLRARTTAIFQAITDRLPDDHAQIVLMGYPNLLTPKSNYVFHQCVQKDAWSCSYQEFAAGDEIRKVANEMAMVQQKTVDAWNAEHPHKVHYIDSVREEFEGHEPDPSVLNKNDYRWVNEFFETEGYLAESGKTESHTSFEKENWYHPNKIGHERMGNILTRKVGVPSSVRTVQETTPNGDVPYPEIPETVSAWIQGPYAHQIGKPLTLDARGSYSTRGDLVKYEWDLDGDEQYEIESTEPTLTHTWESEYVGDIHLRVTGPRGFTDTASTDVMITNDGDSTPYDQDNCPEVNNHGQTDYDGDGIGDECDTTPGYPQEDQPGVGEGPAPTPTPTPSSSPSATPTPTTDPTPTPIPSASASATPTEQPSIAPSNSPDPSTAPIPTLTPSGSPAPTGDPSQLPPSVPVPTSATPTGTPTQIPTPTPPPPSRSSLKPGLPRTGN